MKAKDLRSKQPADLGEELLKLRREQFNLRMARCAWRVRPVRPQSRINLPRCARTLHE